MKAFFGSRISDHMIRTPEGYLVCRDVPIARTGIQQYAGSEFGGEEPEKVYNVKRPEEEVFNRTALVSFEGKPVVDEHPDEDISADNVLKYIKGTCRNVRRGDGPLSDCIIADLIIYDSDLIHKIEEGKRDISCGYDCLWDPEGDDGYIQREIRGNHVAVVDRGRAGHKVAIRDANTTPIRRKNMKRSFIAVPIGDPAGVGPEIVAKSVASKDVTAAAKCVIVGNKEVMDNAIKITGENLTVNVIDDVEQGDYREGILNLIHIDNMDMSQFAFGKVSGMCGKAAYDYIEKSIELANNGKVDAVATTPINKESLRAGGINFIGHTEIFGALTNTEDPLTMFETNGLRVFFLTRHVSLREMLDMIKKDRIIDYVKRCTAALEKLGVTDGVMAIAGLNPHSGEHGLFGWEEVEEIVPAIEELKKQGYKVEGPIGADSVFHQAAQGKYSSVLSLYHDQGHIATKTLDFEKTIAITNGMPILRTSVDHGTVFDIAGKGVVSAVSMIEAILLAAKYAPNFTK